MAARRLLHPGSTMKPFTLLALEGAGIVNASTALRCARTLQVGSRRLDCVHVPIPEPIDRIAALAYSCNSFFVRMAEHLPPDALYQSFVEFGLNTRTRLVASEEIGVIRKPATPDALGLMAIGEAGIETTPLALAAAYRRLALGISKRDSQFAAIREGMEGAVSFGTAQLAKPVKGSVAGKTGTTATHGWFVGFAPATDPKIVVMVLLDKGGGGSDAAPAARRIFETYL